MQFGYASADSDTGQQFAYLKGLGEIVISSGPEALYYLILFFITSKQNDVCVVMVITTYLAAQFQPGDVRHLPVGDNNGGLVDRDETHGLTAISSKEHRIFFVSEGAFNQLPLEVRI